MLKKRIIALERRFKGMSGLIKKDLRLVYQFDGEPEPEERPNESLLVIRVVNTRDAKVESKLEAEPVARFEFGSGEGQTKEPDEPINDRTENSQLTEREKTTK